MRFNMLHPPFDNVKLRRALLPAISQADFMGAAMGGDPQLTRIGVGVFTPGSPLANTAGLETLTGPRDVALAKKLVAESGYSGEKIVFLDPDRLSGAERGEPGGCRSAAQGRYQRRRAEHGLGHHDPAPQQQGYRGQGRLERVLHRLGRPESGRSGRALSDRRHRREGMVRLVQESKDGGTAHRLVRRADLAAQKKVAEEIQLDVWQEAPYYPLGQWLQPIAHHTTIQGIVKSPFPLFWNVKRTA